jgi:hypothetical protein
MRRRWSAAFAAATGRLAGDYLRRYRKSHATELGDALIAAAAVKHLTFY